jgi:hypothetical protein
LETWSTFKLFYGGKQLQGDTLAKETIFYGNYIICCLDRHHPSLEKSELRLFDEEFCIPII